MKNVLIVHYHFFPVHNVGVKQFAGYCKYLPEYGWQPVVLTKNWDYGLAYEDQGWGLSYEPEWARDFRISVKIYRAPYRSHGHPVLTWHNFLKERTEKTAPLLQRLFLTPLRKGLSLFWPLFGTYPDAFIGWIRGAIETATKIIHEQPIHAILSNCPPQTNHLVASHIAHHFRIPWAAYFGDLYSFYVGPRDWHGNMVRRFIAYAMNRYWLRRADYALAVSPYMVKLLNRLYGLKGDVVVVGYDESDFATRLDVKRSSRLRISHVGSVYPGDERPEIFFDAVDCLIQKYPEVKKELEVIFIGSKCESQLQRMVSGRSSQAVYNIQSKVSPGEAICLQQSSDILLLFNLTSARRYHGTLSYPCKIFEYFGARRPILAMPGDGDWVDTLLRTTQAGVIANTAEEAAAILEKWYFAWRVHRCVPYQGKPEAMTTFTHRRQAEKIATVLDRFCGLMRCNKVLG